MSKIKTFAAFLVGAGIGSLITYKLVRDKYEAFAQEEIDAMREFYIGIKSAAVNVKDGDGPDPDEGSYDEIRGEVTSRVYKKIARTYTDYNSISKKEVPDVDKTELINPCVISIEEFTNGGRGYDKLTIYYYEEDDTLADDQEEVIANVEETIGEALLHFGEDSDDPDIAYVRNSRLGIDYEIIRLPKSYQEAILGFTREEETRKKGGKRINERE